VPAVSKRELIITEALKVFYKNGFKATGVDRVIKECGVSKKTLYNHFRSKDELVLATLRKRDELFRHHLVRETERLASEPKARLLAIFDVLNDWFKSDNFSGCMFINASAEYPDKTDPCRVLCAEHKRLVWHYFKDLAEQAGASDALELAKQLSILVEGAIVCTYVEGDEGAGARAKRMGNVFIEQALI